MESKDLIRKFRKEQNLTQIELAEKAGISVNTLRLYEGGKRQPSMKQLQRLADALGVSSSDLTDSGYPLEPKSMAMYPTEKGTVIFCMTKADNSVYIMTNYPMVPIAEESPWRLSKEAADDIELLVSTYCKERNVQSLPPEIGEGILTAIKLLAKKGQQRAKEAE